MKYFSGVIYRLVLIRKDGSSRLSDVRDINGKNSCKYQWGKSCASFNGESWKSRAWLWQFLERLECDFMLLKMQSNPLTPPLPSRDAIRRKPFPCFISFLFYTNIGQCKMCYVDWKPVLFPVYTPYIYVCTIKLSTSIKDTRTYN